MLRWIKSSRGTVFAFAAFAVFAAVGMLVLSPVQAQVPGDLNGVDTSFVAGTVALAHPGDIDGDLTVGFTDFLVFASAFGSAIGEDRFVPLLDLVEDGRIDFSDFLRFAMLFGNVYTGVEAGSGFRDDFDSNASGDDWELIDSDFEVVDGVLHLTGTEALFFGTAARVLETPVTEWVLQTRMARNEADGLASVSWVTGRDGFTEDLRFRFEIGTYDDGDNYKLAFWGARTGNRVFTTADFHGNSGAISEETGEFTDITFSHQNGEFALVAGETELFRVATSRTIEGFLVSDLVNRVNEVWLATTPGNTALFDWVDLATTEQRAR